MFKKKSSCYNSNKHNTNFSSIFIIKNPGLTGFIKIIGVKNQLPITFGTDLIHIMILKVRNPNTHTYLILNQNRTKSDSKIVFFTCIGWSSKS